MRIYIRCIYLCSLFGQIWRTFLHERILLDILRDYEKFLIDLDCRSISDCLREIEIFKYTIYIHRKKEKLARIRNSFRTEKSN